MVARTSPVFASKTVAVPGTLTSAYLALRLFAPERENPFLYEAGDRIRFVAVTGEQYETIRRKEGSS